MPEPNDLVKARQEAAALLGLDPKRPMCPADSLRVDLIATLRSVIDAAGATAMEGGSADVGRLVTAVEQLTKLLPKAATEAPSHREDPRKALLEMILQMRDRDEAADRAEKPSLRERVAVLEAENAKLRAAARAAPGAAPVEAAPAALAANVVPMPRAPAPPAEDMVDLRAGFNDTREPWREYLNRHYDPWADNRE
jgi:nucleoid-associated protein YgaU